MVSARQDKPRVLFVGSFREAAADGTVGGQMYACRALVASPLTRFVSWIFLDSTAESIPPPPWWRRAKAAAKRIGRICAIGLESPPSAALIFTSFNLPSVMEKALMARILRRMGVRVVLALRSEVGPTGKSPGLALLRRWVNESADVVVCQSERAAQAVGARDDLADGQAVVIKNWIDAGGTCVSDREAAVASTEASFLYLGWLVPSKGVLELVASFARVLAEAPEASLEICGEGTASALARDEVWRLGLERSIRFLGWVRGDAKRRALERCRALVLPSHSEGMPNAVLEAMAAGRAVIATRVGGVPELVEEGRSGLLVEAGDVGALAGAILRLARDRSEAVAMGARGREIVEDRHDVRVAWRAIGEVLGVQACQPHSLEYVELGARRDPRLAPAPEARGPEEHTKAGLRDVRHGS